MLDAFESRASATATPQHYRVRAADAADAEGWNEFLNQRADGTFFHRFEWAEILQRAFGHKSHFLLAERLGQIGGILPLARVNSWLFGDALISTPFCVYGGILAADQAAFDALEAGARQLAHELHVDYLEMRNRRRQHPDWPCRDLYVTFRKEFYDSSEKNMLAIPRKQRAMVRKGLQKGLRSEIDADVERHYAVYSESLRNLGTPVFSKRYLKILRGAFGDACEVLTITHHSEPVASVLSFYFKNEVIPYYGGGTSAARSVAGNDFMYWEVMERARQCGKSVFDFGRSKRGTGAFDFKRNWGFEPDPLFYEYHLVAARELPNVSPVNSKYRWFIRTWQRLPLWLTRIAGPWVAAALG
jgi:FemAB-related protein (PEP-CTERM system-associated)